MLKSSFAHCPNCTYNWKMYVCGEFVFVAWLNLNINRMTRSVKSFDEKNELSINTYNEDGNMFIKQEVSTWDQQEQNHFVDEQKMETLDEKLDIITVENNPIIIHRIHPRMKKKW